MEISKYTEYTGMSEVYTPQQQRVGRGERTCRNEHKQRKIQRFEKQSKRRETIRSDQKKERERETRERERRETREGERRGVNHDGAG